MFALAWPIVLTNLSQMVLTATDIAMLGHFSSEAMAAATIGGNLYYLFFPVIFGIAMGAAPMLAYARGRKLHHVRDMRRTVRQGFWACAFVIIPVWLALWNAAPILRVLGQTDEMAVLAQEFTRPLMWGLLPFGWFMVLRGFIAALERPHAALVITVIAILFNALADWVLIFGHLGFPAMGITGAGIASSLSNLFMFLGLLIAIRLDRRMRRFQLMGRFWRADWSRFRSLLRIGVPISLTFLFETSVFNAAAFMMGWISVASVAAHAIAINTAALMFMIPMGLSQAATARVGLALGARNPRGAVHAGWTAMAMTVGCMALTATLLIGFPHWIINIFLSPHDPAAEAVTKLAIGFLFLAGLFQFADGLQAVASGALRGLADTRAPMIFAACGYWGIGLPTGALLAFGVGWDGYGIWSGLVIGLFAVSIMLVLRWAQWARQTQATPPAA